MVIGLVVPVLNNFLGFTELMESIKEPVVPIVCPNWKENLGVSKAWNDGIAQAIELGCEHVFVANDDIVLTHPETLTLLSRAMDWHSIDLLTPSNVRDGYAPPKPSPFLGEHSFGVNPDFSAFMIRPKEFVERFGLFDENFYPAYFEDNDMAYRIKLYGGCYANHLNVGFLHKGSVTQNSVVKGVVPGPVFEKNRSYYCSKWGGMPLKEVYQTPFNDLSKTLKDW